MVKLETVIAWHRRGWKSRHPQARPSTSPEVSDLIRKMSGQAEQVVVGEELFEAAKAHSPEADKALDEALETARFWVNMKDATASLDQDRLDQALTGFQQALAIRPDNSDALAGVAGTLMKQREPAKAVLVYRRWTQVSSNDPKAWEGLLRSL